MLHSSQKVECRVHRSVSKTDFSCKYAGKNDCQKHSESKTHQQLLKTRNSIMSMTSLVAKSSTEVEQQRSINRGEVMMCKIITGLNLPIASADILNKAVKNMFPDSNITQSL
jgi:hypothetical protein